MEVRRVVTVELTLPYPPTANLYYRHVGARVLVSARGRKYRTAVGAAVLARGWAGLPVPGRLALSAAVYTPDRRARDLDNLCKGLLDALQAAGVYESDSQIDELALRRMGVAAPDGLVVVSIRTLEG